MAKSVAKKRGRSAKVIVPKYTTLNMTSVCKNALDEIREELESKLGFRVSYSDALGHILKAYREHAR